MEDGACETIANINAAHNIFLVQNRDTGKFYVKKILDIYNPDIYQCLSANRIPGTPCLYSANERGGHLVLIEEYVSGTPLRELIEERRLSFGDIISYMSELCDILERLHSLDPPIVHRDIKPSNIIITSCGHVCLIDFNAAKYAADNAAGQDTVLLGTQGYAAPEQYGFGPSTPRTDIYAAGVLLKEMAGSLSEPTEPTDAFDAIIQKCTEINPSERMATARELKDAIESLRPPVSEGPRPRREVRKKLAFFTPPGFRSREPWKMTVASIAYIFIFWMCMTLQVDSAGSYIWLERFTVLLIFLFAIACCFNYLDIWRHAPLSGSRFWIFRAAGVFLLYFAGVFALVTAMLALEYML